MKRGIIITTIKDRIDELETEITTPDGFHKTWQIQRQKELQSILKKITLNTLNIMEYLSLNNNLISFDTEKDPYGWIQFKGTNICMDIHCKCGELSHIDDDFVYFLKCPNCGTIYELNGHIELIERDKKDIDKDIDIKLP